MNTDNEDELVNGKIEKNGRMNAEEGKWKETRKRGRRGQKNKTGQKIWAWKIKEKKENIKKGRDLKKEQKERRK